MAMPIYFGLRSLFAHKHPVKVYKIVKNALTRLIKKHKLSIAEISLFGNRLIAMDRKMNRLILIHYKHGIVWEKCLNLHEMVFCRIAKIAHKLSGDIQKVNLELTLRNGGIITFSFFDEKIDVIRDLPARTKRAQYWKGKFNVK
jgi:hypothetical protein